MDAMLHENDLHILCIFETWLAKRIVWEINAYLTYKPDRSNGHVGRGVLILVRNSFSDESMELRDP